ncbi:polysaccharide export protein [Motiliproteus sp. MSK22-1]|uniref:polysaccharide export protein n=1 Tax=Motiliproteus sp. MSK22-1 TaxID=1897630 RepID=UPI0018E9A1B7|nr:polysaccharide export protein [Motiliproteus sp. MSK22-1]
MKDSAVDLTEMGHSHYHPGTFLSARTAIGARYRNGAAVLVLLFFIIANAGCSIAPGMQAFGLKQQSRVTVPAASQDESPPEHIKIKPIDAQLIIELDKKQQLARSRNQSATQNQLLIDNYVYRLGPADIISIIVWDHPELTIPAGAERSAEQAGNMIANDGTIFFPYAGVVKVAGKTLTETRALLTKKLSKYIEDVKLDVRVAAFNSQRVYMVGEVNEPSVKKITDIPPTIIEMVNRAGGFTSEADRRNITLTRGGKTYRIDLLALYENGDSSQNILLEPGDVVNVWDRDLNKVFVLGEVNGPGSFKMNKRRKSLAEALAEAGGVNQNTSDPSQIFVVRGSADQPGIFHLDASTPDALILADRFPLEPRDVIYVDTAQVVRWNRVIENVSGTVETLNSASNTNFPLFNGSN